ncbi:hypothetical protein KAT24_02940 [Candidatus Pacearchaeota archaeon]|nr:hypothetical protein [Candidatus Pacearchaeota archaeon]
MRKDYLKELRELGFEVGDLDMLISSSKTGVVAGIYNQNKQPKIILTNDFEEDKLAKRLDEKAIPYTRLNPGL